MADRSDIDAVLARTDIVSLVEQYTTLKRAGTSFKGLCPFHQEKTPSFTVSPDKGWWHCFGQCSEGGDAIKFVQKIENLSFPEALERLALRAGVTLAPYGGRGTAPEASSAVPREMGERDRLYRVNALALQYYRQMLMQSPEAQEYLRSREIAHATQELFSLGYAQDGWDGLVAHLSRKNISLEDAERAGLIAKGDRGGYYDKLRGRLIFPIFDVQERPVAFGGRLIGEANPGQPKYWNSPETPVFSKSKTLYGLWRARKAISACERAVVVEGYTDVVAAHQAGFENVVATLGTSLTEEHVRLLGRLAPTVLLAFDADSAGLKAAFRAAEMFEAQEVEVRVMDLPEGDDPDSLIRSGRRAIFEQAMDDAPSIIEYRLRSLARKGPLETERDRVALFRKAIPILASVPSTIEREQYVKMLAPYHPNYRAGTTYAEEQIRQDAAGYGRAAGGGAWNRYPADQPKPRPAPVSELPARAAELAERHLLRVLAGDDRGLADRIRSQVAPSEFASTIGKALAEEVYRHSETLPEPTAAHILAAISDDALRNALSAIIMAPSDEPLTDAVVADDIAFLKRRLIEVERTLVKTRDGSESARFIEDLRLAQELKGTQSPYGSAGR